MNTAKKILNISLKVLTWMLVAFSVLMMIFTVFTTATVDRNDRGIFGIKFYIVTSNSMSLSENNADMDVHFNAGDIVIIREVENRTALKPGNIIAFMSTNDDNYGETVTHMIKRVEYDEDGTLLGYTTFGTNTGDEDDAIVEPSYVLGEYAGKLPSLGYFFAFVKSLPGYIICILIPFLLLILYNGVNVIRLFRKYKKEQTAILEAERAEIAEERKQNEAMLRELQALKAQLDRQSAAVNSDSLEAKTEAESASNQNSHETIIGGNQNDES